MTEKHRFYLCLAGIVGFVIISVTILTSAANSEPDGKNTGTFNQVKLTDDGYSNYYLQTFTMPNGVKLNCIIAQTNEGNSVSIDCPG